MSHTSQIASIECTTALLGCVRLPQTTTAVSPVPVGLVQPIHNSTVHRHSPPRCSLPHSFDILLCLTPSPPPPTDLPRARQGATGGACHPPRPALLRESQNKMASHDHNHHHHGEKSCGHSHGTAAGPANGEEEDFNGFLEETHPCCQKDAESKARYVSLPLCMCLSLRPFLLPMIGRTIYDAMVGTR